MVLAFIADTRSILAGGTTVMADGTLKMKDGTTATMQEGIILKWMALRVV